MHLLPPPLPGDSGFVFCDFVRVSDAGLRLRRERERAALECAQGAHHEVGAEAGGPIVQNAGGGGEAGRPPAPPPKRAGGPPPPPFPPPHAAPPIPPHDPRVNPRGAA